MAKDDPKKNAPTPPRPADGPAASPYPVPPGTPTVGAPTPIGGTPPPPPDPPYTPTPGQFATLRALLQRYGLLSLYDTAKGWLIDGTADDENRLLIALRETQEFRDRFKGMFTREQNGLPPISVNEYLQYENFAMQKMQEYGFPPGYYDDPDDFANLIGGNVSMNELEQRLASYADAAAVGREQVRQQLAQHMGVEGVDDLTQGELAAWFNDPQRGLQVIRQRLGAAQVSAAASDSGFGALSYDEASMLGGRGITEDQARQQFAALAQQGDVTRALAGETEGVDRATQIGAVAGEAEALTALERAQRRRTGVFEGGGTFSVGREGISGVGTAR